MEELTTTPTPTPTPAPPDPMVLPKRIDAWSDWAVQPGLRPRLGQIVHGYAPVIDVDRGGRCSPMLVHFCYISYLPLRIEVGSIDPLVRLADPRHPGVSDYRHNAHPEPVFQQGMPGQPRQSWHRVAECPWNR